MTANENGGCPEGQTADGLDAVQGIASTVPQYRHSRLRGATASLTDLVGLDELDLDATLLGKLRGADENATDGADRYDGYVVVEVAGDLGGSTTPVIAPVNYAPRWYAGYLGNGERAL